MPSNHSRSPIGVSVRLLALVSSAALTAALTASCAAEADSALSIDTNAGTVVGAENAGMQSWLGIPYAAAPVGALRWQPPQPVEPWSTPLAADRVPSSCAQNADLGEFAVAGGSEDCLYLNVYRDSAAARTGENLPVFVWIHGGALAVGQGADYDATKLARDGGAIVVTLNYRLGVLGFLSNPGLDGEGHDFANYGLMDQQAALGWVQQNIAAFGGDPDNVTIAGESSGGNSVMVHVASPRSAGLFDHAIAMSGAGVMTRHPAFGAPRPLEVARKLGTEFADAVGCTPQDGDCLRALPLERVLETQTPYKLNEFIIDGTVLPQHPSDAYRNGQINHATLVAGSTRDEGQFFVALPELESGEALTEQDYRASLESQFGGVLADEVLQEYPLDGYASAGEAFAATLTDSMFACTGRAMAQVLADKMPVYAYEFSDRTAPSYVAPTTFPLLAAHTFELPYLFPGFNGGGDRTVELNELQEVVADEMVDYFVNVEQLPSQESRWPRFDPRQDNVMTFALPRPDVSIGRFADDHHCEFWDDSGVY